MVEGDRVRIHSLIFNVFKSSTLRIRRRLYSRARVIISTLKNIFFKIICDILSWVLVQPKNIWNSQLKTIWTFGPTKSAHKSTNMVKSNLRNRTRYRWMNCMSFSNWQNFRDGGMLYLGVIVDINNWIFVVNSCF